MPEAVSLVVPVRTAAGLPAFAAAWGKALTTLGRDYEILFVNDGGPAEIADAIPHPKVRVLSPDGPRGYGACLRAGFAAAAFPLVAYTSMDEPFSPADLGKLLARLDEESDVYGVMKKPDAAAGYRTGVPVPAAWKLVGRLYRGFIRVALGSTLDPLPGWLGFQEHARSWLVWLVMGVPLADVNCRFKVVRKSVLEKFPIQSDSDFVHAEIFAKLTFLTCLVAEEPLTPAPRPVRAADWSGWYAAFSDARFHPQLPDLSKTVPPTPLPVEPELVPKAAAG